MKRHVLTAFLMIIMVPLSAEEKTHTETIKKTWTIDNPSKEFLIVVDNVFGSVTIKGIKGKQVKANINKSVWARSEEQMVKALEEVKLDILEETEVIELYVDGPFREKNERKHNNSYNERRYRVSYDFEVQVPRDVSIEVRTVNGGEIDVSSVLGDFDVHNVNGGIRLAHMAGSGDAITVNGPVTCRFEKNPNSDCEFRSINGDIRLYFENPLSLDISFDTLNGEMYSDFKVTSVPDKYFVKTKKNGKTIYKAKRPMKVRAGNGGPLVATSGINGDLFVLKND